MICLGQQGKDKNLNILTDRVREPCGNICSGCSLCLSQKGKEEIREIAPMLKL